MKTFILGLAMLGLFGVATPSAMARDQLLGASAQTPVQNVYWRRGYGYGWGGYRPYYGYGGYGYGGYYGAYRPYYGGYYGYRPYYGGYYGGYRPYYGGYGYGPGIGFGVY
jgi:hypothetical protein